MTDLQTECTTIIILAALLVIYKLARAFLELDG